MKSKVKRKPGRIQPEFMLGNPRLKEDLKLDSSPEPSA